MFAMLGAVAVAEIQRIAAADAAFKESIAHLQEADREKAISERRERMDEAYAEALAERRHREMVEAARQGSGLSPIGVGVGILIGAMLS